MVSAGTISAHPKRKMPIRRPKRNIRRKNVMDWRNHRGINAVTPAKAQGQCGACVAFSFIGLLESMLIIEHGLVTDLSEAEFYFCGGGDCKGWWHVTAMDRAVNEGAVRENILPWTGSIQSCPNVPNRNNIRIRAFHKVTLTSDAAKKTYLNNVGPLVACFYVYEDFNSYWNAGSGIYSHLPGVDSAHASHCVLVIGYDNLKKCWICKNSFGMSGPENNGIFRMDYDSKCEFENSEFLGLYEIEIGSQF